MKRFAFSVLLILSILLSTSTLAFAQEGVDRPTLPQSLEQLDTPLTTADARAPIKLNPAIGGAGPQQVIVRLGQQSVGELALSGANVLMQRRQLKTVKAEQAAILKAARALDPNLVVLGRTQRTINTLILRIDASALPALAANAAVLSINPLFDYEMDLSETVPYIGATAVQGMGYDGTGVRVGVIDSGIDYNHIAFGGSGDPADFEANDPTIIEDGSFPTAKVAGGWDFVGGNWVSGAPLEPDPDPLDAGPGRGHGTHVADIIGGITDGASGVAPGTSLYALKVCSSITTSCSGAAMLQAMDWAIDPNGDGDVSDHLDVINMSIGSPYGQSFDDDTAFAAEIATYNGVIVATSSGNSADKPYVTGTPGAGLTPISTAQTQVPSAVQAMLEITAPASIAGLYAAVWQPWSGVLTEKLEGPIQYGDGAGGNLLGCTSFPAGSLAGKIVLVDRGTCNFSLKISNIADGGALAGIIGLVAPGAPFEGGAGAGDATRIPGYMISQVDSNKIKSKLSEGVTGVLDPANGIPLVMHMVGSSSRGPTNFRNMIKPEIGAPGASISAVAGSGMGVVAFGGTSGASPMVAGSASLLVQAFPDRMPLEIKAMLVNNAETNIMNEPEFFGGYIAPITRIGGGEVRVDRALGAKVAVWDTQSRQPTLSYGMFDSANRMRTEIRHLTVKNFTDQDITYNVYSTFRFQNDADLGAVSLDLPSEITVPAHDSVTFRVTVAVNSAGLNLWTMNSGNNGANPHRLTDMEFDGYVWFDEVGVDEEFMVHVPWMVLPRTAGDPEISPNTIAIDGEAFGYPAGMTTIANNGANYNEFDMYSLVGVSPDDPTVGGWGQQSPVIDLKYIGVQTFGTTSCSSGFVMQFVAVTWDRYSHAIYPAGLELDFDIDQDGNIDSYIYNGEVAASDGRVVTWARIIGAPSASAYFYLGHKTNSSVFVFTVCGEQIGLTAADVMDPFDVYVFGWDNYFTGNVTDYMDGITVAPFGERYMGVMDGGQNVAYGYVMPRELKPVTVVDIGGVNPTEMGILLNMHSYGTGAPIGKDALPVFVSQP